MFDSKQHILMSYSASLVIQGVEVEQTLYKPE